MKHNHTDRQAESGNALWFILVAIGLLTALSIVISRSSDTSEQSGDFERLRVQASDIMRYASSIEQAVDQMRLRGVSENSISFENDFVSGYANARCPDNGCKLFHVEGGGLTFSSANSNISTDSWLFSGANSIAGVGTDGSGATSSSDNELLIMLPISQALCARINAEIDINSGAPQDAGQADISAFYVGTFPNGQVVDNMNGAKTGCFEGNQDEGTNDISGTYYFYHTLVTR